MKNPYKFGDKVNVPGRSSSRLVTEVIGKDKIRIMDLVEITDQQRRDWLRTPVKGEIVCIPGMVVSTEGVELWSEFEARCEVMFK